MATSTYKIILHRYVNGDSRFSNPIFYNAPSFDTALAHANAVVYGLAQGNPDHKYVVASIEHGGLRGDHCTGAGLFETAEELSARVAAEQEQAT